MNGQNRTVRDWTEEDEKKYIEMLATHVKRPTDEEMLKLAAVSPHQPLEASEDFMKYENGPYFDFDKKITKDQLREEIKRTKGIMRTIQKRTEKKPETKKILKYMGTAFILTASVTGFATLCGLISVKYIHNNGIAIAVMSPFFASFATAMVFILGRILEKIDH